MSESLRIPSFAEVAARIDHDYFDKCGIFGISVNRRLRTIQVHVQESKTDEFNRLLRDTIVQAAKPYSVEVTFEPPARLLSGRG
jgi:hypothetical protein